MKTKAKQSNKRRREKREINWAQIKENNKQQHQTVTTNMYLIYICMCFIICPGRTNRHTETGRRTGRQVDGQTDGETIYRLLNRISIDRSRQFTVLREILLTAFLRLNNNNNNSNSLRYCICISVSGYLCICICSQALFD